MDTRHAHSIRQNPTSGRLWVGRDFIGGAERPLPLLRREPGPTAYGAPSADLRLIRARINNSVVGINPWARIHGIGSLETLESARNQWLKENGYTGGVRTFVNPRHRESYLNSPAGRRHALAAYAHQGQHRATPRHPGDRPTGEIRPRATFELPADMPRFTPRMQVLGSPATGDRADPRVARLGSDAPVHAQVTRLD
ncbi:MAG: hypothetical protein EA378_05100 [Phycisphaerales bacterium]|nr:MAG: hypothetical protein EA378_05100 [Phycisphaerales bacterium]